MEQGTNAEPKRESSGYPHKLTRQDCVRGGQARSPQKERSARLNPLVHGKYARTLNKDYFLCSGCGQRTTCPNFSAGSTCSIVSKDVYKKFSNLLNESPAKFFEEILQVIGTHNMGATVTGDVGAIRDSARLLMLAFEMRQSHLKSTTEEPTTLVYGGFAPDWKYEEWLEKEKGYEKRYAAENKQNTPPSVKIKPAQPKEKPISNPPVAEKPPAPEAEKPKAEPKPKRGGFRAEALGGAPGYSL